MTSTSKTGNSSVLINVESSSRVQAINESTQMEPEVPPLNFEEAEITYLQALRNMTIQELGDFIHAGPMIEIPEGG